MTPFGRELASAKESLAEFFRDLNRHLDMPSTLAEMGVPRDTLSGIAQSATKDHSSATNPRPAGADDYLSILEAAYAGVPLRA